MYGRLQVERRGEFGAVVRASAHLAAWRSLVRSVLAAAVAGDHAIALAGGEQHLVVPIVGTERRASVEDDRQRILWTPIFVEVLRPVPGRDSAHLAILPWLGVA